MVLQNQGTAAFRGLVASEALVLVPSVYRSSVNSFVGSVQLGSPETRV